MTPEEVLLEKFKVLPANRQQQLLDFAEFLESKEAKPENNKEFRVKSRRMSLRKGLNYDNIGELLEQIESVKK